MESTTDELENCEDTQLMNAFRGIATYNICASPRFHNTSRNTGYMYGTLYEVITLIDEPIAQN